MKSYYILNKIDNNPIIIDDGFNWWCFFFGLFWALYKGVWQLAGIFFAIFLISTILLHYHIVDPIFIEIIRIYLAIALSYHANDFLKNQLLRQGYKLTDITTAPGRDQALIRHLDHLTI